MELTNNEAMRLLAEHKRWLEEPPIINGTGRTQKLCEALQIAIEALERADNGTNK